MACSSCGGNRLINRSVNPTPLKSTIKTSSYKDSDFILGYVLADITPLVGGVTGINYGNRSINDKIFIHINDIDDKIFGKNLPQLVVDTFVQNLPQLVVDTLGEQFVEEPEQSVKKVKRKNDN